MASHAQKFATWIREHKLFALALPVVFLLLVHFLTTGFEDSRYGSRQDRMMDGYDNSLPDRSNRLQVENPNTYYKESIKDSLDLSRPKGKIKNIQGKEHEKDSLQRILEDLDNFSLDNNSIGNDEGPLVEHIRTSNSVMPSGPSEAEKNMEYRNKLLQAREERLSRSQDYSVPKDNSVGKNLIVDNSLEFKASIYRDQFILPGDRVTILLDEPLIFKGNVFKKNTFIYANANIQGSRVLLNVTNIDHIPIKMTAKDIEDGNYGLYKNRAGELWREFQAAMQSDGLNEISEEVSQEVNIPVVGGFIRSFAQFFKSKKYREKDKILLANNEKLILTTAFK